MNSTRFFFEDLDGERMSRLMKLGMGGASPVDELLDEAPAQLAGHVAHMLTRGPLKESERDQLVAGGLPVAHLIEGITKEGEFKEHAREAVESEVRAHFRPEFLNRVDEIVLFKPLRIEEIEKIVDLMVAEIQERLSEQRIKLKVTAAGREHIARAGYDPIYGARPLKRFLQREVETRIARLIVGGEVAEGSVFVVDAMENEIRIRLKDETPAQEPQVASE